MIFTENNNSGVGRILRMSGVATAKRFGPDSKIIDEMLDSLVKSGSISVKKLSMITSECTD
ncbi:hypothetical protein sscle_04g035540 [Sclerotinia sclerotiorum 1980 UF-70]|uniref:Uncharacterized protein n=1 Tax=Sclerotinia sclerotiorum (strain ATCC 18683 / 1980 / Ss-1) TaxID=665079 RepID=A0A1D9Q1H4_SCLS1|nr:hypothetical protein sscle_04g035540 [Sclerotinia sclerotiorum 1980 UF-70]